MLLYGKPLAEKWTKTLIQQKKKLFWVKKIYVALIFLGENSSSRVYVNKKKEYGEQLGISSFIFWQEAVQQDSSDFPYLEQYFWVVSSETPLFSLIDFLNQDPSCVGIVVQLPLPPQFNAKKNEILWKITPEKDLDGLTGDALGKDFFWMINFSPATPKAVFSLLDYYKLWNLQGKQVCILWKSIIVGKPLALECIKRGAFLGCFDLSNSPEEIKNFSQNSEYIFSATGSCKLIDQSYLNSKKNQILIDIGYGHLWGKAIGDVDFESVKDKVLHISPVPGGVGPLTIVALFSNIFSLQAQKNLL